MKSMGTGGMALEEKELLAYRVGPLLYVPANHSGIAEKVRARAYPCLTSIAFCLEDAIRDEALEASEDVLKQTLSALQNVPEAPLLFVRVRSPEHLAHIHRKLGAENTLLTGYILPKFDASNGEAYACLVEMLNHDRRQPLYVMPILESKLLAEIQSRTAALLAVQEILGSIRQYVLNIRVGGNDFTNLYGLRRSVSQNIYQIGVVRDILMDILNVFAPDYVVSGPVWEYFGEDPEGAWAVGLQRELALDRLNGFIGKTAIHPSQLPVIYESMKVSSTDYEDAVRLTNWESAVSGVAKSADGSRMHELKCHENWARRTVLLGDIYGVKEERAQCGSGSTTGSARHTT